MTPEGRLVLHSCLQYTEIRIFGVSVCIPFSCDGEARCKNCSPNTGCKAQLPHQVWYAKEHGSVKGETDMISALQDGPIVCGMAVTQQFEDYEGFAVFVDKSGDTSQDHAISIVGYGTESGTKYWIGRNSWGTWWGNEGYFRIERGTNNLGIEEACSWATPADKAVWVNSTDPDAPTFTEKPMAPQSDRPILNLLERGLGALEDYVEDKWMGRTFMKGPGRPPKNDWEAYPPVITEPEPHTYIDVDALPAKFQWNSVNGTNYATLARNQHIPQCLVLSPVSTLSLTVW